MHGRHHDRRLFQKDDQDYGHHGRPGAGRHQAEHDDGYDGAHGLDPRCAWAVVAFCLAAWAGISLAFGLWG
jgi:hypothetical protein